MAITLKICQNEEEWNNILDRTINGTLFHTWSFLNIMEKHSKINFLGKQIKPKLYPVIGLTKTVPIGVCPLYLYDTKIVRFVASPPARVEDTYLGPLQIHDTKIKPSKREKLSVDFQKEVDKFIFKDLKASYTNISTSPGLIDSRPFRWTGYNVEPLYTGILSLEPDLESIWRNFDINTRNNIKKTEKRDISVVEGTKEDIGDIYNSLVDRRKAQSETQRSSVEYLKEVVEAFYPENINILIAKHKKKTMTGNILLYYKDTAYNWVGNAKIKLKGAHINDLVQWKTIQWVYEKGFKYYDLVDVNKRSLGHFKSHFNPTIVPYFLATKYNSTPGGLLLRLHNHIKNRT